MNELDLLARLRDEVPGGRVSARSASRFAAGLAAGQAVRATRPAGPARPADSGRPARRGAAGLRRWRLATGSGLAAAVAAGAVLAAGQLSGPTGASALTLADLVHRAAAAAASQPAVRPGQWVYRELYAHPGSPWLRKGGTAHWATADNTANAFYVAGRLVVGPWSSWGKIGCTVTKGETVHAIPCPPGQQHYLKFPIEKSKISYADLGSLPSDPRAVIRYLLRKVPTAQVWAGVHGAYTYRPVTLPRFRVFNTISWLLYTYVVPPGVAAELYQVLGDVPGIALDRHLTDVAGRTGIGFVVRGSKYHVVQSIILNPRTYQLMAVGNAREGIAVLREALVSGPGKLPRT